MSTHTPGPWSYGKSKGMHVYVYAKDATQPLFDYKTSIPWPNKVADLRLIAAAPELLEALRVIADSEEMDSDSFVCDFSTLQSVARAAIAKAEGR